MRKLIASFAATAMLALGVASTAAAQQNGDGLVVVQIENVLNDNVVQVVVPVDVAAAIAANVCGVVIPVNILGTLDFGGTFGPVECNSRSRAFNTGDLTVTNN